MTLTLVTILSEWSDYIMLDTWGAFLTRHARATLTAGVAVVIASAVYGVGVFGSLSNGGFDDPATESARELSAEQAIFGDHGDDLIAIYSSPTLSVDDPAFQRAVDDVLAGLPNDAVDRVVSHYGVPSASGLVSSDGHATRVFITLAGDTQDAKATSYDAVDDLLAASGASGLETDVAGPWSVYGDVNDTVAHDIERAESLSMPIVFLLSLVIFGSVVAALMPTLVGAVAVFGAFAVVRVLTGFTDVSVFAINVITLIGMGLAIDYALFVVSRFREELANQPGTDQAAVSRAIQATMATAGRTVLFSGLTVAASLAALLIFPQNFLRSMGMGGMAAVLVAMTAALTILPAVLMLLGRRIEAGSMPWRRRAVATTVSQGHGVWARIAHSVMARPVRFAVVAVALLLALGIPFLSARWGSVDERVLPADSPSRVAAGVQAGLFGGETSSASIVVTGASDGDVAAYRQSLSDLDGIVSVDRLDQVTAGGAPTTRLRATWLGNSQAQTSQDVVEDIRSVAVPGGGQALVGGASAQTVDLVASIGAHLPWMAAMVVVVMLVLLFLAFGSVVLPLKAVAMNTVSLAASFGIVTWIFQDGHLSGLLGFTSPGYLDVTQPILMLGILFGLSMDYEVFLLSRMREEWDRTGDNTAAVAAGLQRSGRIITSAALLLAVVIGGFATSGIVFLKMIGVGMLVAVLLDATVVRAILVPATMRLLGRANWWAPSPLRRWWERHGVREADGADARRELVGAAR
jgi:RND superfamily putative drug exporter